MKMGVGEREKVRSAMLLLGKIVKRAGNGSEGNNDVSHMLAQVYMQVNTSRSQELSSYLIVPLNRGKVEKEKA